MIEHYIIFINWLNFIMQLMQKQSLYHIYSCIMTKKTIYIINANNIVSTKYNL